MAWQPSRPPPQPPGPFILRLLAGTLMVLPASTSPGMLGLRTHTPPSHATFLFQIQPFQPPRVLACSSRTACPHAWRGFQFYIGAGDICVRSAASLT